MAAWPLTLCLLLCVCSGSLVSKSYRHFSSNTEINNVVQDPGTGRVYVGAVNTIYQLDNMLQKQDSRETGPKQDNQACTPPKFIGCVTKLTSNSNKLLLVNRANGTLVVCGSLFRGICSLLSLENVSKVEYYSDSKGEKTYVVSTEDKVSVVGVLTVVQRHNRNTSVFLVGKGYGAFDTPKLITTRLLRESEGVDLFESYDESSVWQASAYTNLFRHIFRLAFQHVNFTYFLFSRTNARNEMGNYTFISRVCQKDTHYYSYMELQLNCSQGGGQQYSKVQAAFVAFPGERLARSMDASGRYGRVTTEDKVLFVVFGTDSQTDQSQASALCMYSLKEIDERLKQIQDACYTGFGYIGEKQAVYTPYSTVSNGVWPKNCEQKTGGDFPCGEDFLPSPLASMPDFGISAEAVITYEEHLSAVAVAVENEHTIAFLGTARGWIYKVHLNGSAEQYDKKTVGNTRVNKNLFFDVEQDHIYVTTEKEVTRVPVQECHWRSSCQACVAVRDPYCGWCVAEGKCTRKSACPRAVEDNHWIWSPSQECVHISSYSPENMSRMQTSRPRVSMTLVPFPDITESDQLECDFGGSKSQAVIEPGKSITCSPPEIINIPQTPESQDFVAVEVKLTFKDSRVELAVGQYRFYDCSAASKMLTNMPCASCVTSKWRCQWNIKDHQCSENNALTQDVYVIKHAQPMSCPRFESPSQPLISVGLRTSITFTGRNLDFYKGRTFKMGTELMGATEVEVVLKEDQTYSFEGYEFSYNKGQTRDLLFYVKEDNKKIDSNLTVTLYNCSFGREDCSLCKAADPKYSCVWCSHPKSCLYSTTCRSEEALCPMPKILDIVPRNGPLEGGISLTIKGSNMGIKKEDIVNITVADVLCQHKEDRYSVSTSVVCELEAVTDMKQGSVMVVMANGFKGVSDVEFAYRAPEPQSVTPKKGPRAGGTSITITGSNLNIATREDLRIQIAGAECTVLKFDSEIVCRTGKLPPSSTIGFHDVVMKYGKRTTKYVSGFEFCEDPTVTNHFPDASFMSGGRLISVTGTGFAVIQKASMRVVVTPEHSVSNTDTAPARRETMEVMAEIKNETTLQFLSPVIPKMFHNHPFHSFSIVIVLDNVEKTLQTFKYYPDPTFNKNENGIIPFETLLTVKGERFTDAMTMQEAQAYVGDAECTIENFRDNSLLCKPPATKPHVLSKRFKREADASMPEFLVRFGAGRWVLGKVNYDSSTNMLPLHIILPVVLIPMVAIIGISVYCYRRQSQQAERDYEKVRHQLENLEESVRDRCKKEFTDLMIEMEDHTSDLNEVGIPFLDYKTYTDRVFFLPSKDGMNDVMITGKLDIPAGREQTMTLALNQFSNLLNSKPFLINFIRTLESQRDFNARAKVYFASLLTVALHGKLEYYTDIMNTLLLQLMDQYVAKNPKLMLRRSETVVERMLCNWMSICLYQFLKDSAGEPLYKLFKAIKHQVEKGPVDGVLKKAKYTLNDTGLLGDDVDYCTLTLQVLVHGEGPDICAVKVLNCDTISQVKEKIIDQVYRNMPYSQRPKVDRVVLEWRPGSTGQILSDLDLTSQKEGRWKRINTLAHYNVRDNATLVLSKVLHTQQPDELHQDSQEERNALLEDDNKVWHLVRSAEDVDESKSKRGSMKDKGSAKAITEIYLTRLLSVKGTLQQFVDDFFRSVLCSGTVVPPAVKYFFDFLDEQAAKHDNVDEETIHIWKTNSLPLRFWVNILKNPHFIFDVHVHEMVDASLSVIAQTFMDACTKSEHKLSRDSPSNKLLYAKEISTYKKMVDDYYKGIRQMVQVSDQDMNTHLAEVSRAHTDQLNTQVALHQLYRYASKYYDEIINSLEEDPATQNKQLTVRLQQIAAALENKVTDL
ncbi:plexin-B2-like [Polyodon spathula]|uniref:plexin-B2-like n=1 Tax=Polyodon spathula TaxID=7913 RepID=UPI001B7F0294|nr:plexin-B2-like [Polyodon spathula]